MHENLAIACLYGRRRTAWMVAAPRFAPRDWWSADLWAVSKSMCTTEFEIKLTRSDFKADAKKNKPVYGLHHSEGRTQNKHDLLATHSLSGPNRFYYVTPENLIGPADVPEWAGLIYLTTGRRRPEETGELSWSRYYIREVKGAPRLHETKFSDEELNRMRVCLSYRFWDFHMKKHGKFDAAILETTKGPGNE